MSGPQNGDWHSAHGGLPIRAPTLDEAIPYSPFTSIVPFSSDIIPFPSAEPPTPPSTLTAEQQRTASRTVHALNEELRRNPQNPSRQLQQTLQGLEDLLDPNYLPEFQFKPVPKLPTPPHDSSPTAQTNGSAPKQPALSYFARKLLNSTEVAWQVSGSESAQRPTERRRSAVQSTPQSVSRPVSTPQGTTPNTLAPPRILNHHPTPGPPATPSSAGGTPRPRTGPAVIVKPLPPSARPEDYRRFDIPEPSMGTPKKKERPENGTSVMKSREREIADQKIKELYALLGEVAESRDTDQAGFFVEVETNDGELTVLRAAAVTQLAEAVSRVDNLGCLSTVPTKKVLLLQSLCEPLIAATSQMDLDLEGGAEYDLISRLAKAQTGLRACKLVLLTMIEGCEDRRICSEDRIQGIFRLLRHVLNKCIIPLVESRRTGSLSTLFNTASQLKNETAPVLRLCGNVLSQIATLIGKIRLSTMTLSPIESAASEIIFVQNSDKEADSVLGIQKFESFRQKAMDVLAQVFACHVDQRDEIVSDILANLEKLPDKRGSARQFKSAREPPMMLVSALFMRLVHAAASNNGDKKPSSQAAVPDSEEESESEESDSEMEKRKSKPQKRKATNGHNSNAVATQLAKGARVVAGSIANMLVIRAENVSKSGDKPFRNLLDLFIEDLCNVLGSPEWPAATVFLESLLAIMIPFINAKEKSVQAADMALYAMGSVGVGLIDFDNRLRHMKRSLDISESDLADRLVKLADDALKKSINIKDVLAIRGPYRVMLGSLPHYLHPRASQARSEDPHLRSLSGYYATTWANAVHKAFEDDDQTERPQQSIIELKAHVDTVVADPNWYSKEFGSQDSDGEVRLAAGIIASQETICRYTPHIVSILLNNTTSHSAKVKSRAMTSLTQMIEKDPQILDDKTFPALARLIKDFSPMVRENTVSLISKCLEQDPTLERHLGLGADHSSFSVFSLLSDTANGPKKKVIKLLKDIYATTSEKQKKVRIATELLLPILDDDKPIAELARQTFEDIWIAPLRISSKVDENQLKLNRETRVSLLIHTVERIQVRPTHLQAFEAFFKMILSPECKTATENFRICKELVADMVDVVINTDEKKEQARTLQSLSIFAKVNPKLFVPQHVKHLKLYVQSLQNTDELEVFRPTLVIFRYVFPALPTLQEPLLEEVRESLMKAMGKLAGQAAQGHVEYRQTLLDLAHCSWTISPLIKLGMEKLIGAICSIACQLEPFTCLAKDDPRLQSLEHRALSYLIILGIFGKVCNFDEYIEPFKAGLQNQIRKAASNPKSMSSPETMKRLIAWKGHSVALLFLDLFLPFTKQAWNMKFREQALCSIGEVCQQNTKHFTRADIERAFKLPFINKDATLTKVVLTQFRDFLENAERRSETGADIAVGEGAIKGAERLENSFNASDNDLATTLIARTFLGEIVGTALGKDMDLALPATEILVSISRQGLLHPKETGAALVALTTSLEPLISQKAAAEHRKIHLQHETMFEKEYVTAVTLAYEYQRDVFNDPRGAMESSFKPKMQLLFEAFKQGSRKTLKKFMTKLLGQLDFDLSKLDVKDAVPEPLLFARFTLENCAFFDYAKVDEVIHVILTIEDIVLKQSGPSVAVAIEDVITNQLFEQEPQEPSSEGALAGPSSHAATKSTLSEVQLRQLTAAAVILHMMWETRTFLRRAYNLTGKLTAKDMTRPATRMNFVTGKDVFATFTSLVTVLDSPDTMKKECNDFADIMNVDKEHAVGDDDDDARDKLLKAAENYETPDEDEDGDGPAPTSGRNRKRKSSAALGNTPKKARGRASLGRSKAKRNSRTPDDSD